MSGRSETPDPDGHRHVKRRRPRPQLSCTECRRLKMKCDRQFPCGNCRRRDCADQCRLGGPTAMQREDEQRAQQGPAQDTGVLERLAYLESLLREKDRMSPSRDSRGSHPQGDQEASSSTGVAAVHAAPVPSRPTVFGSPAWRTQTSLPAQALQQPSPERVSSMRGMPALTAAVDIVNQRHLDESQQTGLDATLGLTLQSTPRGSITLGNQSDMSIPEQQPITSVHDRPTPTMDSVPSMGGPSAGDHDGQAGSSEEAEGVGTLVMFPSGRAKFLGRTAASEWLTNKDFVEAAESPPPVSRIASPDPGSVGQPGDAWATAGIGMTDMKVAFPFNTAAQSFSTAALLGQLPTVSDGQTLVNVYFRHYSWHFHIVSREKVNCIFNKAYSIDQSDESPHVPADELALLYIIYAVGSIFNLELPPDDSSVDGYVHLARCCLSKADFLARNTLAGVQTLHIMAHVQLCLESGRNGDSAWPLWGLMLRILQGMGMHRDGKRFGLPDDVIEERRRVFWECYSTDVMLSNNFSRPGSISPAYIDTAFPTRAHGDESLDVFHRTKFEMASLFMEVLDHIMQVNTPPYSNVLAINERICQFERNVPFQLRCRPVLAVLPSAYPDAEAAVRASPPIDKRNLQHTFQIFTLAMNITECLVHLHRPYFARALYENPGDPTKSKFGASYLAVVERCNAISVIASNLYTMYPQPAARHWWIWYHAFSSAACMGTLVLKNPQNALGTFALTVVDNVINIYSSVVKLRNSPRMNKNLNWLVSLRSRLDAKIAQTPEDHVSIADEDDDLEFLGWKTRLIERVGQDSLKRARGVRTSTQSESPSASRNQVSSTGPEMTTAQSIPPPPGSGVGNNLDLLSGETLLDQFWDSVAAQDGTLTIGDIGSVNWWSRGFGAPSVP